MTWALEWTNAARRDLRRVDRQTAQRVIRGAERLAETDQGDVLPRDGRICCTVSSRDPRALPLYVRFGMRPYWPHTHLRVELATLSTLPAVDIDVLAADVEDPPG